MSRVHSPVEDHRLRRAEPFHACRQQSSLRYESKKALCQQLRPQLILHRRRRPQRFLILPIVSLLM